MRETILLDALEKIKKECASDYAIDIATKALSDYASAPESGGEGTYWGKRCRLAEYLLAPTASLLQPQFGQWQKMKKDFVPNNPTPSTSPNSIEQHKKLFNGDIGKTLWDLYSTGIPEDSEGGAEDIAEMVAGKSVMYESDFLKAIRSLSKEEGKDEGWMKNLKEAWYRDNYFPIPFEKDEAWQEMERHANIAYKYIRQQFAKENRLKGE